MAERGSFHELAGGSRKGRSSWRASIEAKPKFKVGDYAGEDMLQRTVENAVEMYRFAIEQKHVANPSPIRCRRSVRS